MQREREQREEERRDAAERRDAIAQRPVVVIEHAGASPDGGQLERRLVKVRVCNKGPTTAHRVEVGIRLDGEEFIAGPGGTPGMIEALAPTDAPRVVMVQLDRAVWQSRPLYQVDNAPLWARWTDPLGNPHATEVPSP